MLLGNVVRLLPEQKGSLDGILFFLLVNVMLVLYPYELTQLSNLLLTHLVLHPSELTQLSNLKWGSHRTLTYCDICC